MSVTEPTTAQLHALETIFLATSVVWRYVNTSKSKIPATYPNPNIPETILMQAGRPGERFTLSIAPSGAYLLYRNGVEITLSEL